MRTFSSKRSALALAIAGVTAMSGWISAPEAQAAGFIEDSTLTGVFITGSVNAIVKT